MFQSTPPAEARGDVDGGRVVYKLGRFNPLPPPKRGETSARGVVGGSFAFQSTPPAEARGDLRAIGRRQDAKCFNPLPPPKRGETP